MRQRSSAGVSNLNEVVMLTGWMSPRARGDAGGNRFENGKVQNLEDQVKLTGWPTPTSQDNDQVAGEYKNPNSGTTLGGAARLSTAETGNRGVLAAEFSRWLMGYPATWDATSPNFEAWQSVQDRIALGGSKGTGTPS